MTYTPLDSETLFSSVMRCGLDALGVWYAILASKDRDGITPLTPESLALLTLTPEAEVQAAWDRLAAPDPKSKNPAYDGRRIIQQPDGRWRVVSSEEYRQKHSGAMYRASDAERKRRQRERERAGRDGAAESSEARLVGTQGNPPDSAPEQLMPGGPAASAAPSLPKNGAAREEYARIIGERALEITGNLQLSSVEFGQILTWREEGIPLRVVLSAIEEGMRPAPGVTREPRSLRYFDPIVREEWERVQKAGTV